MRSISDKELTFLQGLITYPDEIVIHNDLTKDYFNSDYGWEVYSCLINSDVWDYDFVLKNIFELKNNKVIQQDEFNELITPEVINKHWIADSYKQLKEERMKQKISTMLSNINIESSTSDEIQDELKEIVNIEVKTQERFETLADIEKQKRNIEFTETRFDISLLDTILTIESNYLIILGARPGSGKTCLGVKCAMANTRGKKVLFISMEMNKFQIKDIAKPYKGFNHKDNIYILEKASIKLTDIERVIKASKAKFVVIDQLNKINVGSGNIYEMFTKRAQGLKLICNRLKIPIMCLAQASRDSDGGEIQLKHLKGSASIEEEADVIMLLQREGDTSNNSKLFIKKNRSGTGRLFHTELRYNPLDQSVMEF